MRTHCFISTTSNGGESRWLWHTADDQGVPRRFSDHSFLDFHECVDDAYVHGYNHVEVQRLERVAEDAPPAA